MCPPAPAGLPPVGIDRSLPAAPGPRGGTRPSPAPGRERAGRDPAHLGRSPAPSPCPGAPVAGRHGNALGRGRRQPIGRRRAANERRRIRDLNPRRLCGAPHSGHCCCRPAMALRVTRVGAGRAARRGAGRAGCLAAGGGLADRPAVPAPSCPPLPCARNPPAPRAEGAAAAQPSAFCRSLQLLGGEGGGACACCSWDTPLSPPWLPLHPQVWGGGVGPHP